VNVRDLVHPGRRATSAQAVIIALALSTVATALGLLIDRQGDVIGVSFYFLAVVLASAAGGIRAGVIAAVLCSLGFTFFFTAPEYALRVARVQDAVAAVVFLVVGSVVGLLVARMIDERERATERERDARLLGYLATKLLSGEPLDRVLDDFASALIEPFELLRCIVSATTEDGVVEERSIGGTGPAGPTQTLTISIGNVSFGTLTAVRPVGGRAFSDDDRELLEAAAKQAAFALERARLDAQVRGAQLDSETSRLRAALFSSVTHDLRTPLASIKAGVSSLLSDDVAYDPAQRRELLTTVLEETDRMNRLVGNLMDLSRSGRAPWCRREAAAIDEIVDATVARMRPSLMGVVVRLNVRPDLPEVFVDPVRIDRVLTNLLENAASHSPSRWRGCRLPAAAFRDAIRSGSRTRATYPGGRTRARVQAFYRGDAAPERHRERPRARHRAGGRGRARRSHLDRRGARRGYRRRVRAAGEDGVSVKVLVVDDEPQIRRALRTSLEAHGYEVTAVGTGEEGVLGAAEMSPDLILLDRSARRRQRRRYPAIRAFSDVLIIVVLLREGSTTRSRRSTRGPTTT
jgi:signal transduction histidine kinase